MIDNMIRDMIESEIDTEDILSQLTGAYEMSISDAIDAIHEVTATM
ncbi:hypothetical protein VPHF86_0169 [Vibrio phage F86]